MASSAEGALPVRKDGQVETRPMYVEEWLETLPYADFDRTSRLLHETINATNRVALKPGVRAELRDLYDQPYRYYLQSQIKAGTQHTLTSMETLQSQLRAMKQLAAGMAQMTQMIINDNHKNKSLWGSKPPIQATQQTIAYLSQLLIFTYLEYKPTPKKIWQQLHTLYRFAESLRILQKPVKLADGASANIAHSYCSMLLTEVVDPFHLPFGGIWEIHDQITTWIEHCELKPYNAGQNPGGLFVVNLLSDSPAQPYARFDGATATDSHRLLDARGLYLKAMQTGERLADDATADNLNLSENYRRLLLAQMTRAWNLPPKRYFPRSTSSGELAVSCGLQAAHFHMNGAADLLAQLRAPAPRADGLDVDGEDHLPPAQQQTGNYYALEPWNLVNRSSGGCCLSRTQRPAYSVRVGDLIGLHLAETDAGSFWRLGIVRWLMVDAERGYRLGIQLLGADSEPVALCLGGGRELQRGFCIRTGGEVSLLTQRGLLAPGKTVEARTQDRAESLQVRRLLEEMAGFEQFSSQPAQTD